MTERARDIVLLAAIAALVAGGVAYDAVSAPIRTAGPIAADESFVEKATFCPQAPVKPARTRLAIWSAAEETVPVAIEPVLANPFALEPQHLLMYEPEAVTSVNIVGFGANVDAGVITNIDQPVAGVGATACARHASRLWYFAEGSSAIGYNQRLLLYNPLPFEAVAKVSFLTPHGRVSKPGLSDIAVPAGETRSVRVNDFLLREPVLSSVVESLRGRIVAWRALVERPANRPAGLQLSTGATLPAEQWFFPEGVTGPGFQQRIVVANPSDEEASITISLSRAKEAVQPEHLVDVRVPSRTSKAFLFKSATPQATSAVVRSVNGVPVVAERVVWYDDEIKGVTAEVGATRVAPQWSIAPAAASADAEWISVMNPSPEPATLSISLIRPDLAPLVPDGLQNVTIDPGLRARIPLMKWTKGEPMTVLLTSSSPVAAERVGYSSSASDVAAVMGRPLPEARP